ncbi:MAG TPA: FAD-dependent oxidoreductase [Actinomycetota bacterium]|nr:FAD-dependent oxidoreductase [Actinomycetota bacterium]
MAERMLDPSITATSFAPDVEGGPLPERAQVVIVGGGVIGASIAYHLASLGITDVLVLERHRIASGTSWHAAGLVARVRGSHPMTELATYGVDLYRGLAEETGVDVHFRPTGSLTLAENDGRMTELRYAAAIARHHGIEARLLEPDQAPEVWPLAVADGLVGGLLQPGDGTVNPGHAALAFAQGAHDRGVTIREGVRVEGLTVEGRCVTGVRTSRGDVEAETIVLACGLWTRDLAATVGVPVPLYAAEHVHVSTEPIDGAHDLLPLMRALDGSFYARHHDGGLMVGTFEPRGRPRSTDSIPEDWAFGELGPDWEHFAAIRGNAERRIPALKDAQFTRYLRAFESFTPDVNFCLGETAEFANLYIAAGFNSQGIIYAPGAGKALAEWIREGAPTFDASEVDVRRFAASQANERYLHERTTEALGRLYAMHWPNLQATTARNIRVSPLFDRLKAAGACFGELTQWERPMWFAPEGVEPVYGYSFGRQNWFPYSAEEHRAAREAVAMFDLSSFAKTEVVGTDAARLLQFVCTNDVDVSVGKVVYTLFLNRRGGIENDGTVTRLEDERFLVITPTATQHRTIEWLHAHGDGMGVVIEDVTNASATLAVMGPRSRELLATLTSTDLSNDAFPFFTVQRLDVAHAPALAIRASFVGELGWELSVPPEYAGHVYDAIVEAGGDVGLRDAGYHALDSLRIEKGFVHVGHDVGPTDDPFSAGLGHVVKTEREFLGVEAARRAKEAPPPRRLVTLALDDPEPLLLHGESVLVDGEIVGTVMSAAYAHTAGAAAGLAFVERRVVDEERPVEVDRAGTLVKASLSTRALYDPDGSRMRG